MRAFLNRNNLHWHIGVFGLTPTIESECLEYRLQSAGLRGRTPPTEVGTLNTRFRWLEFHSILAQERSLPCAADVAEARNTAQKKCNESCQEGNEEAGFRNESGAAIRGSVSDQPFQQMFKPPAVRSADFQFNPI